MHGDFARMTFDALKHRTRVLMQQGRVQLEADWNEQVAILLYMIRTLTRDLIGPHGGPELDCGFDVITLSEAGEQGRKDLIDLLTNRKFFVIGKGHYYVDGLLCENESDIHYLEQPDYRIGDGEKLENGPYLVYLDVWESHVSPPQDDSILEVALGGIDTATRARTVWAVRLVPSKSTDFENNEWEDLVGRWEPAHRGLLKAQVAPQGREGDETGPVVGPGGVENQLYRVEVHDGGSVGEGRPRRPRKGSRAAGPAEGVTGPTFKYSRVNGSAVFTIDRIDHGDSAGVLLREAVRDARLWLHRGDLVEVIDDAVTLQGRPGPLRRVVDVDPLHRRVVLEQAQGKDERIDWDAKRHPFLRRWEGWTPIQEAEDDAGRVWLILEDRVQIQFVSAPKGVSHVYRPGDYWLIPTRSATGNVEWARNENGSPRALPPVGVHHAYAPLAIISVVAGAVTTKHWEGRWQFKSLATRHPG